VVAINPCLDAIVLNVMTMMMLISQIPQIRRFVRAAISGSLTATARVAVAPGIPVVPRAGQVTVAQVVAAPVDPGILVVAGQVDPGILVVAGQVEAAPVDPGILVVAGQVEAALVEVGQVEAALVEVGQVDPGILAMSHLSPHARAQWNQISVSIF
jgi:hypothetical protein